MSGLFVAGLSF